jgi:hypothetical protein
MSVLPSEQQLEQLVVPGDGILAVVPTAPACAPCVRKTTKWIVVIVVLVLILALLLGIGIPAFLGLILRPKEGCPLAEDLEAAPPAPQFDINDPFKQTSGAEDITQATCETTNRKGEKLFWRKWMPDCGKCCYNWNADKKKCYSWRKHCDASEWESDTKKCCVLGLRLPDNNRTCMRYGDYNFLETEAAQNK